MAAGLGSVNEIVRGAGGEVLFLKVLAQPVKAMRDVKKTEVAKK
jgi:hypothetical protein